MTGGGSETGSRRAWEATAEAQVSTHTAAGSGGGGKQTSAQSVCAEGITRRRLSYLCFLVAGVA